MRLLFFFLGLYVAFGLISCSKNDANPSTDVYLYGEAGKSAVYYKNGEEVMLTDGATSAYVLGAVISGSDVYFAGAVENGQGKVVATYWKNGVEVKLSDGTNSEWAYDIAVAGSDVYVVGYESPLRPKYWKNGVPTVLPFPANSVGIATDVLTVGSDFHILAWENDGTNKVIAHYLKNGSEVQVSLPATNYSIFNDIVASGQDIYIAGGIRDNYSHSMYWKNGVAVTLPDYGGEAISIGVSGSDVYVGTISENYWKNQELLQVTGTGLAGISGVDLAVHGNDLYYAARQVSGNNTIGCLLWKNGELLSPFDGAQSDFRVEGIITSN